MKQRHEFKIASSFWYLVLSQLVRVRSLSIQATWIQAKSQFTEADHLKSSSFNRIQFQARNASFCKADPLRFPANRQNQKSRQRPETSFEQLWLPITFKSTSRAELQSKSWKQANPHIIRQAGRYIIFGSLVRPCHLSILSQQQAQLRNPISSSLVFP